MKQLVRYCGGAAEHRPLMHSFVESQQSAAVVHLSYCWEHVPAGGVSHVPEPPSEVALQNPAQQSSPDAHEAPFAAHGLSTQKPRRLSDVSS